MSRRNLDHAALAYAIEAFIRRKYVVRADERQSTLGLSYVTAEVKDLAEELANLVPALVDLELAASRAFTTDTIRTRH